MIIFIEGCRRVGKSYTFDILKRNMRYIWDHLRTYKDTNILNAKQLDFDLDQAAITRDWTLASFPGNNNILFDRGYWSSFVYGQLYRDKYDSGFWKDHIKYIEETYKQREVKVGILFIDATNHIDEIAEMDRHKDDLETNDKEFIQKENKLYLLANMASSAKVSILEPFQDEATIKEVTSKLIYSLR